MPDSRDLFDAPLPHPNHIAKIDFTRLALVNRAASVPRTMKSGQGSLRPARTLQNDLGIDAPPLFVSRSDCL